MSFLSLTIPYSVAGEDNMLVVGAAGATTILAAAAAYYILCPKDKEGEFPKLRGIQVYHAWNFLQRRYDFLQSNFTRNSGNSFSFNMLRYRVIALAGEDARQAFYSDPHFNLLEGFKILRGTAPRVRDVDATAGKSEELKLNFVNKKFNMLLSKPRLQTNIPKLIQDIIDGVEKWGNRGKNGRIDPFLEINSIVFVTIARLTACDDLAKNHADLKKVEELLLAIENNVTPASVLLPWFPSAAMKIKKEATTQLFTLLYSHVERRRRAVPTNDPIDVLIADGEKTETIVEFVMGAFFGGTSNTGMVSAWTFVYLGAHPEWKDKCREEIRNVLSHHLGTSTSAQTLHEKLSAIPISAWEDEFPTLEACTREAHRILLAGAVTFRRNVDEVKNINGRLVNRGDFLIYALADTHFNPDYYPKPYKYDPGRWLRPDPVPNTAYPFLGWGAGRHVCTGMKVAKLEMKLILAVLLMKYEYKLVDQDGKFPSKVPVPNYNLPGPTQRRPLGVACYLDFKEL